MFSGYSVVEEITTEKLNPETMEALNKYPQNTEDLKTNLSPEELSYFEAIILRKREESQDELEYLQKQIEDIRSSDDDDASSLTHHMGDLGSKEESLDLTYRLIQRNRKYINELNRALVRIENGTYGICRATGEPIEKGRLEFAPHTRYTVEAKKKGLDKKRAAFA